MLLRNLRLSGLAVFIIGTLIWLMGGARSGFTNTSRVTEVVDEITGIASRVYEPGLEPGIEFIAVGFIGMSILVAAAAFIESRANLKHETTD